MLSNYFKTSVRNFLRHKLYSLINTLGLTVGLAASIFIYLWIADEWAFDRFHENADRMYSVVINNTLPNGKIESYDVTPARLKGAIEREIPEVELATQYSMESERLVKYGENGFHERGIYADRAFFQVFSFPVIQGNADAPLSEIKSVAISKKLANKLFQEENPIGKTIQLGEADEAMITSVFSNVPTNSSLQFDFVLPFELYVKENPWTQHWLSGGTQTTILLNKEASQEDANHKMAGLIKKQCTDCTTEPFLFSYAQLYLHSAFENGASIGGRIDQVYLFGAIALLILLMACINFMNLSTARSASRSREVGVRKAIGARKSSLMGQFIFESVLLAFLSALVALVIVQMGLPFFNSLTGKEIQLDFSDPVFLLATAGITLFCGLLAGSYPAFILSRFNPVKVLKGNHQQGLSGNRLRKTLVVVQFTTSVVLVISSLSLYQQLQYISERDLGFDKENVIVVDQNEGIVRNYSLIKNSLNQLPTVSAIAFGGSNIFTVPITTTDPVWEGKPESSSIKFKIYRCDASFLDAMDISLLQGRSFVDEQDAANYIVNKKAAEIMGLTPEEAIGEPLEMWNGKGQIVGVTDDFHNDHLKHDIQPMIMMYSESIGFHYFIKLNGEQPITASIDQISAVFKQHNPEHPFEYTFLGDVFARQYQSEAVLGKVALSFTFIAIFISCLGLFGLASFMAESRTKELGIRKVLGASTPSLIALLFSDFGLLALFSLVLGFPVSSYLTGLYLADYAFHTELSWGLYLLTGLVMLLITFISVGYQSTKAATTNPVHSLRNE